MPGFSIGRLSRGMSHALRDSQGNDMHQSIKLNNFLFLPDEICSKILDLQ